MALFIDKYHKFSYYVIDIMELTKAFDFVKKYKTAIFLPLICVLQLLACFFHGFWIAAMVVAIILLLISDFAHIIYYTLFFQMFSDIGIFSVTCTFVACGLICLKYIIGVIQKKEKFYVKPFVLTCLICIFSSMHFTKIDIHGVYQGSALICSLFIFYFLFVYRDRFKLSKCADYLIFGIIATAAIGLAVQLFNGKLLSIFGGNLSELHRLKLLTGNENSLSTYCSLALSVYVSNLFQGKGNIFKNIILGLIAIVVGLSTLSKCFLIVCVFIIFYLFIMLIWKYKLKSLKFIIPALIILTILSFAMQTRIEVIFERFFAKLDETLSLSYITTGRSDLWTLYINKITSSIPMMLFGVGLFNERLVLIGPHNLLLHITYRMGLVGLLMLGILAYIYYMESNKTLKLTFKNCLTLLVFFLISMVENFL